MAQRLKAIATKSEEPLSMPRTQVVEEENPVLQVALRPPREHHRICCTHMIIKVILFFSESGVNTMCALSSARGSILSTVNKQKCFKCWS